MTETERRLAKYSRYNASAKGAERVERYRATPASVVLRGPFKGQMAESKGCRNRFTSYLRRLEARIARDTARLTERTAEFNATMKRAGIDFQLSAEIER